MDALFFYKHSRFDDVEVRYALRGIERNLPWVNKVWIFGDRPHFLSEDTDLVEHVPHDYIAAAGNFRTPVTNFFLLFYLSAILPLLEHEFLWFCDDFIVLEPLTVDDAKQARVVENLDGANRGKGLWKESLWRTYDLLKRFGYPGWNFETHVPTYFTKTRVLEAYCEFRDFVTEDRWFGMLGPTAILNHALTRELMPIVQLGDEGRKVGFYGGQPSHQEVAEKCRDKTFLNFDDDACGPGMLQYLEERFPQPSRYEASGRSVLGTYEDRCWSASGGTVPTWPEFPGKRVAVYLKQSRTLPLLLNQLALLPTSCIVVCPDTDPQLEVFYAGSKIRVVSNGAIDLRQLAAGCDLAIGQGTPRYSEAMSEAGKPQLFLPAVRRERELATEIARQGGGVVAADSSRKEVIAKLRQVWDQARS